MLRYDHGCLRFKWFFTLFLSAFFLTHMASALTVEIHDRGQFFSPQALLNAQAGPTSSEKVVIESFEQLPPGISQRDFFRSRSQQMRHTGVFVLMLQKPRKLWLNSSQKSQLNSQDLAAVRQAMLSHFRVGNYDAGLVSGLKVMQERFDKNPATPVSQTPREMVSLGDKLEGQAATSAFPWSRVLVFLAVILGGVLLFGLIKNLLRPRRPRYHAQQGEHPQGGGSSFGGGGFLSSVLAGITGVVAGNWLYDQFFGNSSSAAETPTQEPSASEAASGDFFSDSGVGDFSSHDDWGGGSDFGGGGDFGGDGGDW